MLDSLNERERVLAWQATWDPSFDGVAIVGGDFLFRAVNPQFCKILGVTPGDIIGSKFSDITPQPIRDLDIKNAKLVMDGSIDSYLLPKAYELHDGRRVSVILLVVGVYDQDGEFMFFVLRIVTDTGYIERQESQSQKPTILQYIRQNLALLSILIGSLAVLTAEVIKYLRAP